MTAEPAVVRRMEAGSWWVELRPPVDDPELPAYQQRRWVVAVGRGARPSYETAFDSETDARQQANRSWRAARTAHRTETRRSRT